MVEGSGQVKGESYFDGRRRQTVVEGNGPAVVQGGKGAMLLKRKGAGYGGKRSRL